MRIEVRPLIYCPYFGAKVNFTSFFHDTKVR